MVVQNLLSALEDYLKAKEEQDQKTMLAAKKRFAYALNDYIDWRTDGVMEKHTRKISTQSSLKIAEVLSNSDSVIACAALNSAPLPPKDIKALIDSNKLNAWFEVYKDWYENDRKRSIKF